MFCTRNQRIVNHGRSAIYAALSCFLILLSLFSPVLAAVDVRLGETPVGLPIKVADGINFEAVGAIVYGGGCRAPHFVVRGREQHDYWDVLLAPGVPESTRRDYPVGPLPKSSAYVTGRDENKADVTVSVGGYDNNVVSLYDGTVLVQTGANTWANNVGSIHPNWWGKDYPNEDQTTVRVGSKKGQRSFAAFWKVGCSRDPKTGQDVLNWTNTGLLDAAFAGSSEDDDGDGKPTVKTGIEKDWCALNPSGIAAWDRPEVYADPFHKNRVYLSMACARMQDSRSKPTVEVIRRSDNAGITWTLGAALPHSLFYAMATTPNGGNRLWLMGEGFLRWSDDAGATVSPKAINLPDFTKLAHDPNPRTDIATTRVNAMSPQALARLGNGKLVAAYRTMYNGVRTYALVLITGADGMSPQVRVLKGGPITKGAIQAKDGGSVFELALVADSRPTGAGAVVAYWLETSKPPQPNVDGTFPLMKLRARYAVISPLSDQIVMEGDLAEWDHYPTEPKPISSVRRLQSGERNEPFQVWDEPLLGSPTLSGTRISPSPSRRKLPKKVWYGDYFHGSAYPSDRPDAMNVALLWPQDDGLYMRTVTIIDPDHSLERYDATWRKTTADRPAVWGWARADFDKHHTKMKGQGYRLLELNAFVLPGQGERFNAIWEKTTAERPAVWGWARADFDKHHTKMRRQGYRLLELNTFVLPGQGERFNAIWEKTTAERPAVWGWARADFDKRQTELYEQGYRLLDVNAFVLPGKGERFNAIWEKTTADRPAVWGWARADFDKRQTELYEQGYRLLELNTFVLPGQGERFNAIWEKTTADRPAVWGWARNDFDKHQADLHKQGYRLEQINAFVLP